MPQEEHTMAQASEIDFELHTLGWKAFQNLCATIISEVFGQSIQTFFDSNDGGRDGAFHGTWLTHQNEILTGSFTVQCKFTSTPNQNIILSQITDELNKAERLANKGLADNYLLFTNARLTGSNAEKIQNAFASIPSIKHFEIYGSESITRIIRESARLRMLVPRVYGLGDLSQILDDRAYKQAKEILSSLGDDLSKFIITDAYNKSAEALVDHGFVLLLGEPTSGKSTIAATLAVSASDNWDCHTLKVRNADDFIKHYNPNEKQFFWVDDAFGATQIDSGSAAEWNQAFPHINAAIKRGSKVLFTSRTYIYNDAKRRLKESALPVIKESQVVIHVENLSKEEREQILYNHIRLGDQPTEFKTKSKPYLPAVAANKSFTPEIARRLGNPFFTINLTISEHGFQNFVEHPIDLLCEIIEGLDEGSLSALSLVFMRGGSLESPITLTNKENRAVSRLGGTLSTIQRAVNSLNGGLLISTLQEGSYIWKFKHPTVRDAFASIVASSPDLMDIYLKGAPLDTLLREISCGEVGVEGVEVIVPPGQFEEVINRLQTLDTRQWNERWNLIRFLSYRCNKQFLQIFTSQFEGFIPSLTPLSLSYVSPEINLILRLYEFGLLPEEDRLRTVNRIKELAVDTPDSGFLRDDIREFLTSSEFDETLLEIKTKLIPRLGSVIQEWNDSYDNDTEPVDHFYELTDAFIDFERVFETDSEVTAKLDAAKIEIEDLIENLEAEYVLNTDHESHYEENHSHHVEESNRSIFEDVDL